MSEPPDGETRGPPPESSGGPPDFVLVNGSWSGRDPDRQIPYMASTVFSGSRSPREGASSPSSIELTKDELAGVREDLDDLLAHRDLLEDLGADPDRLQRIQAHAARLRALEQGWLEP